MAMEQGPGKRRIYQLVGWSAVAVAIVGGIDLLINFTLLDVVVELILLGNVAVHWKYLPGQGEDEG